MDEEIEDARLRSRNCADCSGCGFAIRWRRHRPFDRPFSQTEQFYCLCALGRAIEENHRLNSATIRRRIHDLADYPDLQMRERVDDQGEVTYFNEYALPEVFNQTERNHARIEPALE